MDDYLNTKDTLLSRYSHELLARLLQAQIAAVLTYTASVAQRMGLGLSEIATLEHLQGAGELTPTQLSARLSMSSGAVTALVDRLERAGYVERFPHPTDRRSSVVRVTPGGAERAMQYLGPLAVELDGITEGLPEGDRQAVGQYLQAVTAVISRHALEKSDAPAGPAEQPRASQPSPRSTMRTSPSEE